MKHVFLLIAVSALLVTLGFAQTPAAGSNTNPANVKGCLGGSDGNYTVVEDGSRQIFKITTSSVDLNPHVGHDVKLTGQKASGAMSSGAADNSFAVIELSMISEDCAAAAATTVGAVVPYSQTVIEPTAATPAPSAPTVEAAAPPSTVSPSSAAISTPAVEAVAPATTVSPSAVAPSTPAVEAAAPAATVSPSAAPVSTPAAEAAAPAATVRPSAAPVSTPTEKVAHSARPSTYPRRLSATQAAATTVSPTAADAAPTSPASETVSPASADAATAKPSSETASAPAAATTTPTATHKAGSLSLLISFVVLVIVLGTLAPLLLRWRKRKLLERTGTPNLSFTNEASSDEDKPEPRKVA